VGLEMVGEILSDSEEGFSIEQIIGAKNDE